MIERTDFKTFKKAALVVLEAEQLIRNNKEAMLKDLQRSNSHATMRDVNRMIKNTQIF